MFVSTAVLASVLLGQEFAIRPHAGRSIAYNLRVETSVQGEPSVYEATVIEHVRTIHDDGTFEIESHQVDASMIMGDDRIPMRDAAATVKTYDNRGVLLRIDNDPNPEDAMRIARLNAFVPGRSGSESRSEWTVNVEANLSRGAPALTIDYKVLGVEKHNDVDVRRIDFNSNETGISSAASSSGTIWIDPVNGAMLKLEANMRNIPLAGRIVDAKMILVAR